MLAHRLRKNQPLAFVLKKQKGLNRMKSILQKVISSPAKALPYAKDKWNWIQTLAAFNSDVCNCTNNLSKPQNELIFEPVSLTSVKCIYYAMQRERLAIVCVVLLLWPCSECTQFTPPKPRILREDIELSGCLQKTRAVTSKCLKIRLWCRLPSRFKALSSAHIDEITQWWRKDSCLGWEPLWMKLQKRTGNRKSDIIRANLCGLRRGERLHLRRVYPKSA